MLGALRYVRDIEKRSKRPRDTHRIKRGPRAYKKSGCRERQVIVIGWSPPPSLKAQNHRSQQLHPGEPQITVH
jgi:hypothetical protein